MGVIGDARMERNNLQSKYRSVRRDALGGFFFSIFMRTFFDDGSPDPVAWFYNRSGDSYRNGGLVVE